MPRGKRQQSLGFSTEPVIPFIALVGKVIRKYGWPASIANRASARELKAYLLFDLSHAIMKEFDLRLRRYRTVVARTEILAIGASLKEARVPGTLGMLERAQKPWLLETPNSPRPMGQIGDFTSRELPVAVKSAEERAKQAGKKEAKAMRADGILTWIREKWILEDSDSLRMMGQIEGVWTQKLAASVVRWLKGNRFSVDAVGFRMIAQRRLDAEFANGEPRIGKSLNECSEMMGYLFGLGDLKGQDYDTLRSFCRREDAEVDWQYRDLGYNGLEGLLATTSISSLRDAASAVVLEVLRERISQI